MPSENTGKKYVIKKINAHKDHVTLSFDKKREKLKISKEAYLSIYLYENKSLSPKDIKKLKEISANSALYSYAVSLLSKRQYSEFKLREKLKAKEGTRDAINQTIKTLKTKGFLDDEAYMKELIEYDNNRGFGKNRIIKHLREQRIPDNLIEKASFSPYNELKKAKGLIPKLDAKYARYAYESKKQHIHQALLVQGYDHGIIKEALSLVKPDKPKVEKQKLINDFKKIKKRYENKYDGYELKQKIYAALLNKGYRSSEIKIVLEEYSNENDF